MYTPSMNRDKVLIFADHTARFYAEKYGFAPVTGRVIGYLSVCQPMEQSINDIADALFTSRSAINGAIKTIENMNLIQRTRPAGTRADLISLNPPDWRDTGFQASEYEQSAALAREGLELLKDASPERRQPLEMMISMNDFLAERIPKLYDEWMNYHQNTNKK
jgi:DNA-binding transcriptional regulator GbsR (MarR family)